jgi:hypothetical protein
MAYWIDAFQGNKLNPKWTHNQYSGGGQKNGTYSFDIKNSKAFWVGTNGGTESAYWGDIMLLPVNATGDIKIEALLRQKVVNGLYGYLSLGINQPIDLTKYGVRFNLAGAGSNYRGGVNDFSSTSLPSMPSMTSQGPLGVDYISKFKIVRKNGYIFLYSDNLYVGTFAYAPTITNVAICAIWLTNTFLDEKSCEYVKIWPSSVVL